MSQGHASLQECVYMGLAKDPKSVILKKLIEEGKTRRFWLDDGLVYTKRNRLYISKVESLRKQFLQECHDTL